MSFDPNKFLQIPPEVQRGRDADRLYLLNQELEINPNDPNLRREVELERKKQGVAAPASSFDPDKFLKASFDPDKFVGKPSALPAASSLGRTGNEMIKEDLGTALKSGIARSAMKTVRALGSTLLPQSAETWAEGKGFLPTQKDIDLLGEFNKGSGAAGMAEFVGDVATDTLPGSKIMKGANTFRQALPRAAVLGAGIGGVRSTGDTPLEILRDAAEGGVGGVLGEGLGRAVAKAATPYLKPSDEARRLMDQGIYPTMGGAADRGTITGRILRGLENQVESMPVLGMPQRAAKANAAKQLFSAASELAVPPGVPMPTGTKSEILDRLNAVNSGEFGRILSGTNVAAPISMKNIVDKSLEQAAGRYSVSPQTVGEIKRELNEKLWSGITDEKMSGQALWNVTEDMFNGLKATRGNTNAQKLVEEIAGQFKNHLNVVAGKQGFDLSGLRQSASNLHALNRVGGEDMYGPNLMTAVLANNRATGAIPTPKLQSLAEDASVAVTRPRTPIGNRTSLSLWRDVVAALSGSGGPIAAYGLANNSQGFKKFLMREPKYREAVIKALSTPYAVAGAQSTIDEEQ